MFDPTVYENLKVVLEGAVYDLDLDGQIQITDRKDIVDLATFSRLYKLQFNHIHNKKVKGEIRLFADVQSFTDELIYNKENVGCDLTISFYIEVNRLDECNEISTKLNQIWDNRPSITQVLSFPFPNEPMKYQNKITISFDRKITEDQIDDFPELIDYTVQSLIHLGRTD